MRDTNAVTMVGRLVRDVEVKALPSGTNVYEFALANNYSKKVAGEWAEEVSYIDCFSFDLEKIQQYLEKGKQVAITGVLRQDRWQNAEGQNRSKIRVLVNNLQLLGGAANSTTRVQDSSSSGASNDSFGDDIPF